MRTDSPIKSLKDTTEKTTISYSTGGSTTHTIVLGLGAVFGGFWALYNYHRTRRYEAARWLQGVFKDFYLSGRFKEIERSLEESMRY